MELNDEMQSEELYDRLMQRPDADRIVARAGEQLKREAVARAEFREWLTPSMKAEFINGDVLLHSPVKRAHLTVSKCLVQLLNTSVVANQLGQVDSEKALVELGRNDFEPDICFWRADRTISWDADTMIHPAPDLVVEILSKSTQANDRGIKFQSYLTYGVGEYWIVDPAKQLIEQYIRTVDEAGEPDYRLIAKHRGSHQVRSVLLEGLEFSAETAFSEQLALAWVRTFLG